MLVKTLLSGRAYARWAPSRGASQKEGVTSLGRRSFSSVVPDPLAGKKGIITGIANDKSIAYAVAHVLKDHGAQIAITYQNEKTATYTRPLAEALGAVAFEHLDVSQPGNLEGMVERVVQKFGGSIDFAIHSMAFCPAEDLHGRVVDVSEAGFDKAMNISCHSFIRLAKLLEPHMPPGGSLVTMSYLGAEKVVRNYGIMGIIKAALESAVRYLAYDLGPKGIRVYAVSPGPILTRAGSGILHFNELIDNDTHKAPLGRTVTTEEVGNLTAFLVSPAASGMTGQTIFVDAGAHIVA
eukprot:TRINITY_DN24040_c0_g1_i1.p1 TRINITY_DN24040_c0_g1~~TRINITY_DN24040_c0_g1_i1.p1  ORF type:complete len:304 (-),score=28.76 TRINITY_DN24040_c0_g1_i1:52-936(-)